MFLRSAEVWAPQSRRFSNTAFVIIFLITVKHVRELHLSNFTSLCCDRFSTFCGYSLWNSLNLAIFYLMNDANRYWKINSFRIANWSTQFCVLPPKPISYFLSMRFSSDGALFNELIRKCCTMWSALHSSHSFFSAVIRRNLRICCCDLQNVSFSTLCQHCAIWDRLDSFFFIVGTWIIKYLNRRDWHRFSENKINNSCLMLHKKNTFNRIIRDVC